MNPPRIVVQLIHIHGGLKGEIREFDGNEISIGRLPSCSVKFPADEPGVSREHATIVREGNQFRLTDASRFGTFVNGKQVKSTYLRSGDVIEFGPGGPKASFTMEVAPSPPGTAAAEARPRPAAVPAEPSIPAAAPAPPAAATALPPAPPVSAAQKTMAPLVIQLGPTIRAYRELPVVIGAHQDADFVLRHAGIRDRHARISFHADAYWIEDLTGEALVSVNLAAADRAVRLNPEDLIQCSPQGPVFRFLGEGRLAEFDDFAEEPAALQRHDLRTGPGPATRDTGGFLANLVRGLKSPGNRRQ